MVQQDTATRLRVAVARIDRLLSREVLGSGLTRTQFSVLGAVARRGEQRLGDLADREGVNPTMLSRVVGALEGAGHVRRLPDPLDRRAVVVEVTPAGIDLYEQLQRERSALIDEYLAGLRPEEAGQLAAALPLLEGLANHLQRAAPSGGAAAPVAR
ncbi:MAG: MarR family transcriptional regulator [Modestobacter sp.]|jgi:DNA-binding MarR family transcriptional regulator|nr:MarR family transcriptional regulator [Modestobacter sp.]